MKIGLLPRTEFPLLHLTAFGVVAFAVTACGPGTTSVSDGKKKADATELVQEEENEGAGGSVSKPAPEEIPDPVCGNGIAEEGEECDGEDLGGNSCSSLDYKDDGTLSCYADCKFQRQGCYAFDVEGEKTGLDLAITDNGYDGSIESMTCVDIPLEAKSLAYGNYYDLSVKFGIGHSWAGDLVLKVVAPSGRSVTLIHRPGRETIADNGDLEGGSVATLSPEYPLTVSYSAMNVFSSEAIGSGLAKGKVVCKDDQNCVFSGYAGSAENTMTEEPVDGNWRVCFGDAAPGDTGRIQSVALKLTPKAELGAGARFAKETPLDIPDGTFDGTVESMACTSFDFSAFLGYVTDLAAVMSLEHPRPSELVIALVDSEGKPYTLVSRPGVDEDETGKAPEDENATVWPKGATLAIQNYVSDGLRGSSETIGYDGETPLVNACEEKEHCAFSSSKGGMKWPSLPKVLGVKAAGEWKICLGDAVTGNQGKLNSGYIVPSRRTAE